MCDELGLLIRMQGLPGKVSCDIVLYIDLAVFLSIS